MRRMNIKILIGSILGVSLFSISGCSPSLIDYVPLMVVYDLVPEIYSYYDIPPSTISIFENSQSLVDFIYEYELPLQDKAESFDDEYFDAYYMIILLYIGSSPTLVGAELDNNTIIYHHYSRIIQNDVETPTCFPIQVEKDLVTIDTLEFDSDSKILSDEEFNAIKKIDNIVQY